MLASALRAHGAKLVGEPTLGKGRSQTTFDLPDGALLLVSVLKYVGAAGEAIDEVGLKPDEVCKPELVSEERYTGGELAGEVDLRQDPCIDLTVKHLSCEDCSCEESD
jgi:C-terminal processing protease CtpA/Prc